MMGWLPLCVLGLTELQLLGSVVNDSGPIWERKSFGLNLGQVLTWGQGWGQAARWEGAGGI
jgi:hypothetical protein